MNRIKNNNKIIFIQNNIKKTHLIYKKKRKKTIYNQIKKIKTILSTNRYDRRTRPTPA